MNTFPDTEIREAFDGLKLREARLRANLSTVEAAARVGITRQALGLHESGRAVPNAHTLYAYGRAYGVSTDTFRRSA